MGAISVINLMIHVNCLMNNKRLNYIVIVLIDKNNWMQIV